MTIFESGRGMILFSRSSLKFIGWNVGVSFSPRWSRIGVGFFRTGSFFFFSRDCFFLCGNVWFDNTGHWLVSCILCTENTVIFFLKFNGRWFFLIKRAYFKRRLYSTFDKFMSWWKILMKFYVDICCGFFLGIFF